MAGMRTRGWTRIAQGFGDEEDRDAYDLITTKRVRSIDRCSSTDDVHGAWGEGLRGSNKSSCQLGVVGSSEGVRAWITVDGSRAMEGDAIPNSSW